MPYFYGCCDKAYIRCISYKFFPYNNGERGMRILYNYKMQLKIFKKTEDLFVEIFFRIFLIKSNNSNKCLINVSKFFSF